MVIRLVLFKGDFKRYDWNSVEHFCRNIDTMKKEVSCKTQEWFRRTRESVRNF